QADALSAEAQWRDEGSILHLYRRLLAARKASRALRLGEWEDLESPAEVLVYRRYSAEDERIVCINFSEQPQSLHLNGDWVIEVAGDGAGDGQRFDGRLGADQATVLKPVA